MDQRDCYPLMLSYTLRFGGAGRSGPGYMVRILQKYIAEMKNSMGSIDFERLLTEAADEKGVHKKSMKCAIRWFVGSCWEMGYRDVWKEYTGWSQSSPPDVNTAIKLFCESFPSFLERNRAASQGPKWEQNWREQFVPLLRHASSIEEIIAANIFMPIEDESFTDGYSFYLMYRAQRDLYESFSQRKDLSWKQFVFAMCRYKLVRDVAVVVIQDTIKNFFTKGQLNFHAEDSPFYLDNDPTDSAEDKNKIVTCATLYEPEEGRNYINAILFKAEIAHYGLQLNRGKDYSWKEYISDVIQNLELWDEIMFAFRDILHRLNFKTIWQSQELKELVMDFESKVLSENKEEREK